LLRTDGRRGRHVALEDHRRERIRLEGPHDAGRGRKAAGLVDTLSGKGPFTVFAPTNDAFAKLPAGTVDTLVKPENKATLTKILTYHVVAGKMTAADLTKAVKDGGGKATLKTVQGETLTVAPAGSSLEITDGKGGKSTVTIADVNQSNGVVHVVNAVMMPKA
jgi:uncharacterized surface protein with fasciclin (FAS1) repeats